LGRQPSMQEQLVASSLGLDLGSLDTGGLFGGLGGFLGDLFGGPSYGETDYSYASEEYDPSFVGPTVVSPNL
jgi:hypothetical protein